MNLVDKVLSGTHKERRRIIQVFDGLTLLCVSIFVFLLETGFQRFPDGFVLSSAVFLTLLTIAVLIIARVYRAIIRHLNWRVMIVLAGVLVANALVWGFVTNLFFESRSDFQRTFLLQYFMSAGALIGYRAFLNLLLRDTSNSIAPAPEIIGICGNQDTARQFNASLRRNSSFAPAFFLSDDASLKGGMIDGLRVYHVDDLDWPINRFSPSLIVFCGSDEEFRNSRALVRSIVDAGVPVRVHSGFSKHDTRADISISTRALELSDLIDRSETPMDVDMVSGIIRDKVVLVSGAGGSIGGHLSYRIAKMSPSKLVLLDFDEKSLVAIHRKLRSFDCEVVPVLQNITDETRVMGLFEEHRFDIVFHAAAYKHVDMGEFAPRSVLENNVIGTRSLLASALQFDVPQFVNISTDKAVNPNNVMGASKRIGEEMVKSAAAQNYGKRYCSVRFGNVIESSGSVVPLFKEQILNGGPVYLTDRRMTRYFMSTNEATELILQAAAMATGGETYILKMGEPVPIVNIAETLIKLAGHTIKTHADGNGEIEIIETGVRPGEKLSETLFESSEIVLATQHPCIDVAQIGATSTHVLSTLLNDIELKLSADGDKELLKELTGELTRLMPVDVNAPYKKKRELKKISAIQ